MTITLPRCLSPEETEIVRIARAGVAKELEAVEFWRLMTGAVGRLEMKYQVENGGKAPFTVRRGHMRCTVCGGSIPK